MSKQRIVILDGRHKDDSCPVLDILLNELQDGEADVQTFTLRDIKMSSCIGCFRCWLETPGICVETDEGRNIAQAVVHSDVTILLSPVTFGGYSSEIKKAQDRWLPIILPDFGIYQGEVHHKPRYSRYPRLVGIGIQRQPNDEEAHVFKVLVGRNALNFHAPSYAADVVLTSDAEMGLRRQIQHILKREDAFPLGKTITSLYPEAAATDMPLDDQESKAPDGSRRALLVVGSPKVGSPSTSGVLGGYVMKQLEARGWETDTLTLRRNLLKDKGQAELLSAAERADLILLAFPLYIDSLPFLMMKALELMVERHSGEVRKGIAVMVNNGFPEWYNNAPALEICRRFAMDTGMTWLGGLGMGAGEALFRGQPIEETRRNGPPVTHVKRALDLASSALANGHAVPDEAIRLIRKNPIPMVPFRLWRWFFIKVSNRHWRKSAAGYQIGSDEMLAQPYAPHEP